MERKELATMGKTYYSKECEEYVRKSMEQIREGKVRNQKLKNNAPIHTGELEEHTGQDDRYRQDDRTA